MESNPPNLPSVPRRRRSDHVQMCILQSASLILQSRYQRYHDSQCFANLVLARRLKKNGIPRVACGSGAERDAMRADDDERSLAVRSVAWRVDILRGVGTREPVGLVYRAPPLTTLQFSSETRANVALQAALKVRRRPRERQSRQC